MGIRNEHGFTIIEISLFFAVSGLLLVGLLTGIGVAIQNQRFTDSVNGLQSFLQQQYNETQVTINDRQTGVCEPGARGSSDCLIVGKLVDLGSSNAGAEDTVVHSYMVIIDQLAANEAMQAETPPTEITFLNDSNTKIRAIKSSENDQEYTIAWGAKLINLEDSDDVSDAARPSGATAEGVRYLLIVRSPVSGVISTYKVDIAKDTDIFTSDDDTYTLAGHIQDFTVIRGCVASADVISKKALLKVVPGSTQDSVTTQFDTPGKAAWCD